MNKRTIFLLLAFATLTGIGTHLLFKPVKDTPHSGIDYDAGEVTSRLDKLDLSHHSQLKNLEAQNEHLLSQLQISKLAFSNAGRRVKKLTNDVLPLSKRSIHSVDTGTYLVACDSLQQQIGLYVSANATKDSIVNKQVEQYEYLLDNKDSTISCYEADYSALRQTSDTLVLLNQQLSDENKYYQKALLKSKRKTKVFSGITFLLAGVVMATQLRFAN